MSFGLIQFSRWMSSDELWITPNRFKLSRVEWDWNLQAYFIISKKEKEKNTHLIFMALNSTKHLESFLIIKNLSSEYIYFFSRYLV